MCLSGCSSPNSSSSNTKSTAPPAATTTTRCASCPYSTSGGKLIHSDVAVEVRTGVVVSAEGRVSADDTIEIRVKCKNNPHVLQFLRHSLSWIAHLHDRHNTLWKSAVNVNAAGLRKKCRTNSPGPAAAVRARSQKSEAVLGRGEQPPGLCDPPERVTPPTWPDKIEPQFWANFWPS